jgi:uncharacterized protein (DUF2141 family)
MFNGTKSIQCLVKLILFVFFILSHGAALSDQLVTLTVKAFGATPAKGQVLLSVFDSKERYLKQPL